MSRKETEENEPVFYFNTRKLGRIVSSSASSSSSGAVAAANEEDERRGERMTGTISFDYLVMLNYTLSKCTWKLWNLCTCIAVALISHTGGSRALAGQHQCCDDERTH